MHTFAGASDRLGRFRRRLGFRLDLLQDSTAAFRAHPSLKDRFAAAFARVFDLDVASDPTLFDHFQDDLLIHAGRFMNLGNRGPTVAPQIFGYPFLVLFLDPVALRAQLRWILHVQFAAFRAIRQSHAKPSFRLQ